MHYRFPRPQFMQHVKITNIRILSFIESLCRKKKSKMTLEKLRAVTIVIHIFFYKHAYFAVMEG